ncbi:hypothetical protein FQA39_LY19174 [Lamprigera yunnana]|nr:hypothetical protein FQA39_LY19174 [Lamprigera yunnana]
MEKCKITQIKIAMDIINTHRYAVILMTVEPWIQEVVPLIGAANAIKSENASFCESDNDQVAITIKVSSSTFDFLVLLPATATMTIPRITVAALPTKSPNTLRISAARPVTAGHSFADPRSSQLALQPISTITVQKPAVPNTSNYHHQQGRHVQLPSSPTLPLPEAKNDDVALRLRIVKILQTMKS